MKVEPLDLTNCDREPIHLPGQIQAHGVLLALGLDDLRVLQASSNTKAFLGPLAQALGGRSLEEIFTDKDAASIRRALKLERLEENPLHLFTGKACGRGPFHVIGHVHDGVLILELEPEAAGGDRPDFYELLKRSVGRFHQGQTLLAFSQIAADEVRRVSGYDRVMISRFAPDWSGQVIAESMAPEKGLVSFLDLHYPASDISSQARALFVKNTVQMLPDARYQQSRLEPELNPRTHRPLDLSHAFLRGASQMYTEYLINMGVNASLTMAITSGDTLWGMIACHHYARRQVPYTVRTACELLARVVSLQMIDKERHEEASNRLRAVAVHDELLRRVGQLEDPAMALIDSQPALASLIPCGGGAVIAGGNCHRFGEAPEADQVMALAGWVRESTEGEVFASDALASIYPGAASIADSATGVLALRGVPSAGDLTLWFRPEVKRTVRWAGDPSKPVGTGPMGDRLTPRTSFALWLETVEGRSMPWLSSELESAHKLRLAMSLLASRRNEKLARVNLELSRSNFELDSFAHAASHDLKEPLRGIYNFTSFVLQDAGKTLAEADREKLNIVIRLSKRMQALIDSLLHYSQLGRTTLQLETVDMNAAVNEAMDTLVFQRKEALSRIEVPRPLPAVQGDAIGLQEILVNLLSNAIKYCNKPAALIEVGYLSAEEPGFPAAAGKSRRCFFVRDEGIGIAAPFREEVFRIFRRLHPQSAFGGGTGAGLTIVRKVVERHGGAVWCEAREGAGTTFFFTLGAS